MVTISIVRIHEELRNGAGSCLAVCSTGALTVEPREAWAFDATATEVRTAERKTGHITQYCFRCNAGEDRAVLLPWRSQGQGLWVWCTRCLPALSHG